MASFDGNGLVIDRLADVRTAIEDDLREVYGDGINLTETSPFGVLIGIMAERYSELWEMLEAVYEASFPNTSFGVYLDELVAFNGIVREPGSFSSVLLTFTRSNDLTDGDVLVPINTQVTSNNSNVIWSTTAEATILNNNATTTITATPDEIGPIGALAGTLTNLVSSVPNVASVTNLADATEGSDEETDAELKLRRQQQLGQAGTATATGIVSALQLMEEVRKATIIVNDLDISDGDGRPPHSFEAYVSLEPAFNLGQQMTLVFESTLVYSAAFVADNSIELRLNGELIAGSPVVFNTDTNTTLDLVAAAYLAEDEVAATAVDYTRREVRLSRSGAAFTASSVVTLGASQPTATFQTAGFLAGCTINGTVDSDPVGPIVFNTDQINTLADIATAFQAEPEIHTAISDSIDTITLVGNSNVDVTLTADITYSAGANDAATFSTTAPVGTTLDDIAQTIWDSKAAGIQTHGDFTGTATDIEGDTHVMSFSDISDLRLFLEVTLTTSPENEYDPLLSDAAIKQALADYALVNFLPGVDVFSYKLEAVVAGVEAPGINNVSVGISETASGYTVQNPKVISTSNFATVSTSDITIVEV
jgi:uncharacterized phage protein gp47/JayE